MKRTFPPTSRQTVIRILSGYGLALAATGVSAVVRWLLPGVLSPVPYLGFYPAVVVSAALGGVGPGLVATFISLLLVDVVFGHLNLSDYGWMMRQLIWISASIGVSLLAGFQHKIREHERQHAAELMRWKDELENRVQERTAEMRTAQAALKEANDRLEQRVAERTSELLNSERRLQANVAALTRMHALSSRLLSEAGLEPLLQEIMNVALEIMGAQRGVLHLLEGDSLRIAAHHRHQPSYLEFFAAAESQASVSGEAMKRGGRVVVPDIETSPLFAGSPSLDMFRKAGVRAVQSTPILNRKGELVGVLTTQWENPHTPDEHDLWRIDLLARQAADLLEQARGEEALRASEEKFSVAFAQNPAAIALTRLEDGLFYEVNDTFLALLGYSREELIGRSARLIPIWPATEDVTRFVKKLREDGSLRGWEQEYLKKSGERFVAQISAQLLSIRGEKVILLTLVDITNRKKAEAAVRDAEERLRFALEACHIGAWDFDLEDLTAFRSFEHDRIFGYQNLLPRWTLPDLLNHALPEYRVPLEGMVRAASAANRGWTYECRIRRADAEIRWIWFSGRHHVAANGHRRMVGVVQDVTERKLVEEKRRRSLHEKEVLLQEIHHRVKNNLQVICSLVDLQAGTMPDHALSEAFTEIRDRVRSMSLVHEKLYQSENLAQVNFAEYTESLLYYLCHAHKSVSASIQLKLELQPVLLPIDLAVPCGLMLNELATNSLKHAFRNRSEGVLSIALRPGPNQQIFLSVKDNGVGLPSGLDWRQTRSMGLQLVQMLVGQLKGTVTVSANGGTHFQFSFPYPETLVAPEI